MTTNAPKQFPELKDIPSPPPPPPRFDSDKPNFAKMPDIPTKDLLDVLELIEARITAVEKITNEKLDLLNKRINSVEKKVNILFKDDK